MSNALNNEKPLQNVIKTYGPNNEKYTSFIYTPEAWASIGLINLLVLVLGLMAFISVLPMILIVLYVIEFNQSISKYLALVGIIVSTYILIDYHYGWYLTGLSRVLLTNSQQYSLIAIIISLLITHSTLFFFGTKIVKITKIQVTFISYLAPFVYIVYKLCTYWVKANYTIFVVN